MSWLISFAWANSGWKEGKPRITKWKILAYTGTRTHDPWFSSLVPNPLGHPIWYTNREFKTYPVEYRCALCYLYRHCHYRTMRERVFILSCIWYCSYMQWMSFCCLTNRYWSNSKMTSILYDYITEYMKKLKHCLAWYDVAINSTMHTCILLDKF